MNFEETIKKYLTDLADKDECFSAKFQNENKSIDQCCDYIISEAKKMANGEDAIGMSDDDVYYLARHYYEEENIEIDTSATTNRITHIGEKSSKTKTKKKEKKSNYESLDLFNFTYED